MRAGLISDTHDLLRPEAKAFLQGCDHIIHAGDLCSAGILTELASIGPVTAVRGNNDKGRWADPLKPVEHLRLERACVCVVHELEDLEPGVDTANLHVVVSGHSHRPRIHRRDGVLHVNPGSAGPRRFRLPVSVAELVIDGEQVTPRVVELLSLDGRMLVDDAASEQQLVLAGERLATGAAAVTYAGLVHLRTEGGRLVCEVAAAGSPHRCAVEREVHVENARRELQASRLSAYLPGRPQEWRVACGQC